jgi:hypothetical protein
MKKLRISPFDQSAEALEAIRDAQDHLKAIDRGNPEWP